MSYLSPEKAESELTQSIKKATSIEESAPKQKHVRSKLVIPGCSRPIQLTISVRMYCLHLGPPYVCCHLEHSQGAATAIRRGANIQGTHHGAQDHQGRPSQCKTHVGDEYICIYSNTDNGTILGYQRCSP